MAIRMSETSKLGTLSWSLEAFETCPGARDLTSGDIAAACQGCYARGGNYRFANVKAPRAENKEDWKRGEWVAEMVVLLEGERHFRWFDSGDMYALGLAEKIFEVMEQTPETKHWLPTRMGKFAKFAEVIGRMRALPNVMVRFSSDSVTGEYDQRHGSVIVADAKSVPAGVKLCRAYERGGKCGGCRACYDKRIAVIGYPGHGRAMAKVLERAGAVAV